MTRMSTSSSSSSSRRPGAQMKKTRSSASSVQPLRRPARFTSTHNFSPCEGIRRANFACSKAKLLFLLPPVVGLNLGTDRKQQYQVGSSRAYGALSHTYGHNEQSYGHNAAYETQQQAAAARHSQLKNKQPYYNSQMGGAGGYNSYGAGGGYPPAAPQMSQYNSGGYGSNTGGGGGYNNYGYNSNGYGGGYNNAAMHGGATDDDTPWWRSLCSPGGWALGGREEKEVTVPHGGVAGTNARYIGYFYNLKKTSGCHWDCAVKLVDPETNMLLRPEGFLYMRNAGQLVGLCADPSNKNFLDIVSKFRSGSNYAQGMQGYGPGVQPGGGPQYATLEDPSAEGCKSQILSGDQMICCRWCLVFGLLPCLVICCCVCVGMGISCAVKKPEIPEEENFDVDPTTWSQGGKNYNYYGEANSNTGSNLTPRSGAGAAPTKEGAPDEGPSSVR
mmetsp:Transcript_18029/g.45099  ORF Transcript_18029/g.45099 Transcript_18029/m.45099 type:complete len:444 (-) Transcript_18029:581-1912(-)